MIEYRELQKKEIDRQLFGEFHRRQVVQDCWRRVQGEWVIQPAPFVDEWSEEDYRFLVECLRATVDKGGLVYGAWEDGALKGFCSVEPEPFGSRKQYLDLSCIHVSEEMRGQGVGSRLFSVACEWAKNHGAEKLCISAHSAVETQSFYRWHGCVEAEEYHPEHTEREPFDCQIERSLVDAEGGR